jgi:EmrB/QacA subfamily drug resistance transporter
MCSVVGIVLFDESGVAIALTEIREDFGMSRTGVNWVLTTYLVSLSATVAAFGRLADVIGLRAVLIGGSLCFGAMSIAAGLATDPAWLLVARGFQGLGAAAAFPASAGILRAITPPQQLGRALGFFGFSSAVGLMAGPLVGGWLAETISWRSIFFLGAPVVLFVVVVAWRALDELPRDEGRSRFDWGGVLLLVLALGALVGALMQGPVWGWTSGPSLSAFAVSGLAAGLLVTFENGRAHPVIEIDLFRSRTFLSANATTLLAQFAKTAVIVYGPYYMIEVLDMSPFAAGNGLVPGVIVAMFVGPWAGGVVDRVGARRPVLIALAALALSLLYLSFAVGRASYPYLVPGLVVWGFGASAMFAGSRRAVQGAVPTTKAGQASGINSTAQWLGAALAVPIFGAFIHEAPHFGRLYLAAAAILAVATFFVWWLFQNPRHEEPGAAQPAVATPGAG